MASGTAPAGTVSGTFTAPASGVYALEVYRDAGNTGCYFELDNVLFTYITYTHGTSCTTGTADQYKWGHNSQYKDDEIYGRGNTYTAEYWEYDARLLRRWNTDPIEYEWQSTYACFNNNPIYFADPLGLEGEGPGDGSKRRIKKNKDGGETVEDEYRGDAVSWEYDKDKNGEGGEVFTVTFNVYGKKGSPAKKSRSGKSSNFDAEMSSYYRDGSRRAWRNGDWVEALRLRMNYVFGYRNIINTEKKVVSGGETLGKSIADFHPAVPVYNYGSKKGWWADGNDIYGEDQSTFTTYVGIIGIIPGVGVFGRGFKTVGNMKITIYRVWGGSAKMYGKSYSLINPKYVPFYRNFAGLPNSNSGQNLLKGSIQLKDIKVGRWFAAPLDGNTGGLPFELYQNYDQLINPVNVPLIKPF